MSKKFLLLGGGVFWVFGGGGSADFIFMGARIFLNWFAAIANRIRTARLKAVRIAVEALFFSL